MKIALINIEPKVVNTAYMQIAKYHRDRNDIVTWYMKINQNEYDAIYCSSIFDFTPKAGVPKKAIIGGTGFEKSKELPKRMNGDYDYTIYPNCDYSIVRFSRGCIRNCPFCKVPEREGKIRSVQPASLNPNGKWIAVYDNNFFANPKWKQAIAQLEKWNQPIDFNQGIDIRILTDEICKSIKALKLHKYLRIAWDNPKENISKGIQILTTHFKPSKIFCYVMIGFSSTEQEDIDRIEYLRNKGINPFVMPYNKHNPYQKRFARWVNHKAIFKSTKWKDYQGDYKSKRKRASMSLLK